MQSISIRVDLDSKIKLLHVTSSLKVGGAEAVLCDLIDGLGKDQFEHHVAYFHDGPRADDLRKAGVALYQVKGAVSLYDPVFFFRLFVLMKKLRPDCVHSLLWAANISSRVVARLLSIPHISVYHNNLDQDGIVRNILDKRTRKLSSHLVAVSEQIEQSIRLTERVPSDLKLSIIVNGIDSAGVREKSKAQKVSRQDIGLSDSDFVIGSVGRFCPVKNYPLLLESFADVCLLYPKAHLVLVGLGPDEQLLRDYAGQLGISQKVRFVIGQPAYGYYPLFDCFVQSSDKEGVSMALLEALSCGISCIVTADGLGHSVITAEDDGIVVPPGDKVALSNAIGRLASDLALLDRLGAQGRQMIDEKFDRKKMVQAYRDLFFLFSNRK